MECTNEVIITKQLQSYPTPEDAARTEWMNDDFLKLHPGPPIHYFLDCRDEFYHTHPWAFETHVVLGGYREEVLIQSADGSWIVKTYDRKPGTSHKMPLNVPHKLIGLLDGPCITRCEYGPNLQKFGFCKFDDEGNLLHRFKDKPDWLPYNVIDA